VRVDVDEPGGDEPSRGVDRRLRPAEALADGSDSAVLDADVGGPWLAVAVDDEAAADEHVEHGQRAARAGATPRWSAVRDEALESGTAGATLFEGSSRCQALRFAHDPGRRARRQGARRLLTGAPRADAHRMRGGGAAHEELGASAAAQPRAGRSRGARR